MGYNGWTNKQTWLVNLWIENDEVHSIAAREALDGLEIGQETEHALRKYVEEEVLHCITDYSSLESDLLSYALAEVNWAEIVEALKEE